MAKRRVAQRRTGGPVFEQITVKAVRTDAVPATAEDRQFMVAESRRTGQAYTNGLTDRRPDPIHVLRRATARNDERTSAGADLGPVYRHVDGKGPTEPFRRARNHA